jgi:hypothetical protein
MRLAPPRDETFRRRPRPMKNPKQRATAFLLAWMGVILIGMAIY